MGQTSPWGSWIVIPSDTWGGVLEGTSLEPTGGYSAVHYLFRERLGGGGEGGGVGFLPWGSCCCAVGQALSTKWPIVIAHLVTISSSPGSDSALKEFTNSASANSVTWTRAGSSSLSMSRWTNRFLETVSAEVSLRGTNDFALTIRGPRSEASPTVKKRGGGEQIEVPKVDIR